MSTPQVMPQTEGEDRRLRRSLGYWQLTAIGFSGVIGSGWLLGAMDAAKVAGPEAIVSWVLGGFVLALVALVMAALGGARPEAGGLVRWPFYSNGRFAATMAGWGIRRADGGQVRGADDDRDRAVRLRVPRLQLLRPRRVRPLRLGAGPDGHRDRRDHLRLRRLPGADRHVGRGEEPRRDAPRAVLSSLLLSTVVYILLQLVFIGAVPGKDLLHGWSGVNFNSPYAQLAVAVTLTWLSRVLYADAIASPGGSAFRSPRRPAARPTRWPRTASCRPSSRW